ncbi:hypothetical protein QBC39DRAFT_359856 [Podospora conica]|nr:hypothetical protein QBC39DRAFT_359856 [Schizothecium conicum]
METGREKLNSGGPCAKPRSLYPNPWTLTTFIGKKKALKGPVGAERVGHEHGQHATAMSFSRALPGSPTSNKANKRYVRQPRPSPALPRRPSISISPMTGKQLSAFQRQILGRLFQLPQLTNRQIAFVLEYDERTIRRRRDEWKATGEIRAHKDVSKNAEKFKPEAVTKLVEWLKDHDDALLEDCQLFLKRELDLEVSLPTISRQLVKATGKARTRGRARRVKQRREGTRVELDISLGRRKKDGQEKDGEEEDDDEESSHDGDSNMDTSSQPPLQPPVSAQLAPLQSPPLQPPYQVHQHQAFQLVQPAIPPSGRPQVPQVYDPAHAINHQQTFQLPQMPPLAQQLPIQGRDAPMHLHPGSS